MWRVALALLLGGVLAACSRERWPDPPAVDLAQYEADYGEWRAAQQALVTEVLPLVGIWPLQEGDTPFGAGEGSLIVLPIAPSPDPAGTFQRRGKTITVIPARGAALRLSDGTPVRGATEMVDEIWIGSLRLSISDAADDRRWVSASNENHPAVANPPQVEAYPLDPGWRVLARFDAFPSPTPVRVPDVRGGTMNFLALGELVFRLSGEEHRLTAFGEPGGGQFFVLFRDLTNETTTYSGYRILTPDVVGDSEWTVADFNLAFNPPCAYSRFTVCPLPPPENRLPIAVEAGLKRLPSAQGYSPS